MDRKKLIDRLVDRKLASSGKGKAFCICMARRLCFAGVQQTTQANLKK
jgi:hypothetical protein